MMTFEGNLAATVFMNNAFTTYLSNTPRMITRILLFVCCLFWFSGCEKQDLIVKPAYAIGVIKAYQKSADEGSANSIVYSYTVNGVQYDNYYTDQQFGSKWGIPLGNYPKGSM